MNLSKERKALERLIREARETSIVFQAIAYELPVGEPKDRLAITAARLEQSALDALKAIDRPGRWD